MPKRSYSTFHALPRRKEPKRAERPLIRSQGPPTKPRLVVDGGSEADASYSDEGTGEEVLSQDEDSTGDEEDVDAPRVSQWVDEDELESVEDEGSEEEKADTGPSQLKVLQQNLSSIPFGALRKARYVLDQTEAATDSEGNDDSEDASSDKEADAAAAAQSSRRELVGHGKKTRMDIPKRTNKHAPTEVSSKRPVSRLRQVVEVKKVDSRDPRFLFVTGENVGDKIQQNYEFLAEARRNELDTLRENLKRARKMLQNAPRHLRGDYEGEVQRLELTVKRTESIVNKDRMDRIRREALQKASKEEREKRKEGKGHWYLKKSEKRELVSRARYEALAAEGGRRAVSKAIVRRQKKISQKEKRSRPFPKDEAETGGTRKRRAAGGDSNERKRQRLLHIQ